MWPRWYQPPERYRLPVCEVLRFTAEEFGVSVADIKGRDRREDLVAARSMVALIMRDRRLSYPTIARLLGGRDHTTIMYYCDSLPGKLRRNGDWAKSYSRVRLASQTALS